MASKVSRTAQNDLDKSDLSQLEFIYGGTFDPIHFGHLSIIESLQQLAPQTKIRLLPCFIPALKSEPSSLFNHRVVMLKLAIQHLINPDKGSIIVDERESFRTGRSFMVETLISLKKEFPEKNFILVLGADAAIELQQWHRWQELSLLCHLLVLNRPGFDAPTIKSEVFKAQFKLKQNFQSLTFEASGLAFLLKMIEKSESSTQIRQNRQNNLELDSMIPQSVIKYINDHRLYIKEDQ